MRNALLYRIAGIALAVVAGTGEVGGQADDDHGNELSQATVLTLGEPMPGLIEKSGDVDYFQLEVSEPTWVSIYTTGALDTVGSLRDVLDGEIRSDDDSGSRQNFQMRLALASGTYYIRVEAYGEGTGEYALESEATTDLTTAPASIPDANLRNALRGILDKGPREAISSAELWLITGRLYLSALAIADLTGIEHATGLSELDLSHNDIADVSPLAGLTGLSSLSLSYNEIADVSPLAGLTNLVGLVLSSNEIGDVAPLAGLTSLNRLELFSNEIADAGPLAGLTGLSSLSLSHNRIADLGPLAGMTGLSELHLGGNEIRDVGPLAGLTSLSSLGLSSNQIAEVGPLAGMTGLSELYLGGNEILDVSPLAGLTSLSEVYLGGNKIADLSPLAGLTGLAWLVLSSNEIVDVGSLAKLTSLRWLVLSHNEIADVGPLAGLTGLRWLALSHNEIADVGPLAGLTGLRWLDLYSNEIADVGPLAGLTTLSRLELSYNGIKDVSPLAGLTSLSDLYLRGNEISGVGPLAGLTGLNGLDLSSNEIADVGPLAGLTSLSEVYLGGNEIADVGPLAGLTGLSELDLSYNEIADVSPLAGLTGLSSLGLETNRIRDLSPLLKNPGLGPGDTIDVSHNIGADKLAYSFFEERGISVNANFMIQDTDSDEFPDSYLTQIYNDNVLVIYLQEDLTTSFNRLPALALARDVHRWFEDTFDYLMLFSNLDNYSENRESVAYGRYRPVMNDTMGTGQGRFFDRRSGSRLLRGIIEFPFNSALLYGPALHELQHAWGNYAISTSYFSHWGFSSANGQLGGFDRSLLVDYGDGLYSAGIFGTIANGGNSVPYSPIELYFAGLIEPDKVPDLWVARDGEWIDADDEPPRFSARDVREYTIDEIIARVGVRNPPASASQRHFRAAVILLTDDDHPATESQLQELSEAVSVFSNAHEDTRRSYNYFEATGGRGSIAMGDLSKFRKTTPGLPVRPASHGTPLLPSFCWLDPNGTSGYVCRDTPVHFLGWADGPVIAANDLLAINERGPSATASHTAQQIWRRFDSIALAEQDTISLIPVWVRAQSELLWLLAVILLAPALFIIKVRIFG